MKTNLIDKQEITYQAGDQTITGDLVIPANAKAIVIFAMALTAADIVQEIFRQQIYLTIPALRPY